MVIVCGDGLPGSIIFVSRAVGYTICFILGFWDWVGQQGIELLFFSGSTDDACNERGVYLGYLSSQ